VVQDNSTSGLFHNFIFDSKSHIDVIQKFVYVSEFFPKLAEAGLIKKMFRRDVDNNESSH
jgi:hypothetical protein